jgi:hypothetical protein
MDDGEAGPDEFLWPVPGLNILAGGNDYRFHAFLQWQHSPDMREHGYISGFRLAAELLFRHVKETGHNQDQIVFPLGLCWRHHMELQLKSLLMELQRYQREPVKVAVTHNLDKLWKDVRGRLEAAQPSDTEDLNVVEDLLLQLHDTDRTNQEFRYPTTTDKTPSLGQLPWIDLAAFHDSMLRLSNFFDGVGTGLYEDAQLKAEYEQWARQEYGGYQDY